MAITYNNREFLGNGRGGRKRGVLGGNQVFSTDRLVQIGAAYLQNGGIGGGVFFDGEMCFFTTIRDGAYSAQMHDFVGHGV